VSFYRSFSSLHAGFLDLRHHQAHVIGQPGGAVRSQLRFESADVITAIGRLPA